MGISVRERSGMKQGAREGGGHEDDPITEEVSESEEEEEIRRPGP